MTALESSQRVKARRLGRRQLVAGGLLSAAGLFIGAGKGAADVGLGKWLSFESSGPDGARVKYPSAWTLDPSTSPELSLDPYLGYPRQSFALRTASQKPSIDTSAEGSGLPDLIDYSTDAAIIWLMYYDNVIEGPSFSGLSLAKLEAIESEFDGFEAYLARFSNTARSFLLWVWIGSNASNRTVSAIRTCLQSIAVPE